MEIGTRTNPGERTEGAEEATRASQTEQKVRERAVFRESKRQHMKWQVDRQCTIQSTEPEQHSMLPTAHAWMNEVASMWQSPVVLLSRTPENLRSGFTTLSVQEGHI
jgi:succinylglutamate desuccinylase